MIAWKKRCQKVQGEVANRKIWGSKCGEYRVVFSQIRYGRGPKGIPDTYYAMKLDGDCWTIISKHRKKSTAMKACEKEAKNV